MRGFPYNGRMSVFSNIREIAAATFGLDGHMKRRKYRTMSGNANVYEIIYDDGNPVRVMNVRGTYQSATYLEEDCYELVFGYHRAYNAMFQAEGAPAAGELVANRRPGARKPSDLIAPGRGNAGQGGSGHGYAGQGSSGHAPGGFRIERVAMLGGGGFSYPKYLVAHYPRISVDVVEIDPMVVAIAERWFYLDRLMAEFDTEENGRLGVHVADARDFLETCSGGYDAIVNDCFAARVPVMSLATVEAARTIHARLNPGGLYLTNVISALRGPRAKLLHSVMATLQREFAHVHVLPGSEGLPRLVDNYVVVATDGDYEFAHSINVEPDPGTQFLVDARVPEYEDEFFLIDT